MTCYSFGDDQDDDLDLSAPEKSLDREDNKNDGVIDFDDDDDFLDFESMGEPHNRRKHMPQQKKEPSEESVRTRKDMLVIYILTGVAMFVVTTIFLGIYVFGQEHVFHWLPWVSLMIGLPVGAPVLVNYLYRSYLYIRSENNSDMGFSHSSPPRAGFAIVAAIIGFWAFKAFVGFSAELLAQLQALAWPAVILLAAGFLGWLAFRYFSGKKMIEREKYLLQHGYAPQGYYLASDNTEAPAQIPAKID